MLFNSYPFIFIYLPVTLWVFFRLGHYSHRLAATWLTAASLFFYGWWNPAYLGLLGGSIFLNYAIGVALAREHDRGNHRRKRRILLYGIMADLLVLGYYKYAGFFAANINDFGAALKLDQIILPLGISFFTFTQIAFLVDASRGLAREFNFIHFGLFVTYFPHLIAGPVLHHKEMMPQFAKPTTYQLSHENIAVGLAFFAFGLFKKVILADGIAIYASPVFEAVGRGQALTFFEAWGGALAYTFQIYFDFSGYSDMAIGLSRLFGVKLPLNFNSPYKATNIVEFWRCWHMTLSRFLRDYLYIPLGGNRHGSAQRYRNLFLTMLLGGLWHGAGWTFVFWGGLHGVYLVINHAWHVIRKALGHDLDHTSGIGRLVSGMITFLAVVIAWIFFRSENIESGLSMLRTLAGLDGIVLREDLMVLLPAVLIDLFRGVGIRFGYMGHLFSAHEILHLGILSGIVWLFPNTQEIMARFAPALDFPAPTMASRRVAWEPSRMWAFLTGIASAWAILRLTQVSEFLYFQF